MRLLEEQFPYLAPMENQAVVRFVKEATQKVAIDVMKPTSEVTRIVFRNSVAVGDTHRIPDLEMAVISKYIAMKSHERRARQRQQDAADLAEMYRIQPPGVESAKVVSSGQPASKRRRTGIAPDPRRCR